MPTRMPRGIRSQSKGDIVFAQVGLHRRECVYADFEYNKKKTPKELPDLRIATAKL